jgi:preprotein translocase subunit SecG
MLAMKRMFYFFSTAFFAILFFISFPTVTEEKQWIKEMIQKNHFPVFSAVIHNFTRN